MLDNKFERCEPDDPNRCQVVLKSSNQCPYKAVSGTKCCPMHGGITQATNREEISEKRNYRLTKWQARLNEFADNPKVKSLREEVGILRIVMEEILNLCHKSEDILMYSGKITDTATRIEKIITSCHRLEASTGMLLDKSAALHLAGSIVEIIGRHVSDQSIIDSISNEIILLVQQLQPASKLSKNE